MMYTKFYYNVPLPFGKILPCFACIQVHVNEGWMIQDHIAKFPAKELYNSSLVPITKKCLDKSSE